MYKIKREETNKQKINLFLKKITTDVNLAMKELLSAGANKEILPLLYYSLLHRKIKRQGILTVTCCKMLGGKLKDVLYPAAALELIYAAGLILDDIIDNDFFRQRKLTLWAKYGKPAAQCIALIYLSSAFQFGKKIKEMRKMRKIYEIFDQSLIKDASYGEILDTSFQKNRGIYPKEKKDSKVIKKYFEIARKKTGAIIQCCSEIGGICAGATQKQIKALKNYGLNLGMAIRILDDILDIFHENQEEYGKDIRKNVVILLASQEFSFSEKKEVEKIFLKEKITQTDIKKLLGMIKRTKAKEKAINLNENFIRKAKKSLTLLPQNEYNQILLKIADSYFYPRFVLNGFQSLTP